MATEKPEQAGPGYERVNMCIDTDLLQFIDAQAAKLDRSRSYLLAVLCRRYKAKLESEAERREKARLKRIQRAAG
jgi:hypothetical protein